MGRKLSAGSPRAWWLVLVPAFFCLSCGGPPTKLNPIEGQVLYKGQPVEGATVSFHPKQSGPNPTASTGTTDATGKFTLQTGNYEGAPAGDYDVVIIKSVVVSEAGKKGVISMAPPETKDAFGGAYADKNKTKIHETIKNGENKLQPFQLQ